MDLKNKLKGLPPIWVLNLDERPDRREYAEKQYEYWGIKDYVVTSGSKFQYSTYHQWKHLVNFNFRCELDSELEISKLKQYINEVCITLSHVINIKTWLETSEDPYVIIMEDDYDLSYIEYWHFDWEYLMNNIPHDWDCIQMSFENNTIIPCYLHPILSGHGTGASLINRNYAEKLIRLYYIDGKYDFSKKIGNWKWNNGFNRPLTIDYILGHSGKTYCIPLISINIHTGSYAQNILRTNTPDWEFSVKAYKKWWTNLRDRYTLEDFFAYGKPNDRVITQREPNLDDYV